MLFANSKYSSFLSKFLFLTVLLLVLAGSFSLVYGQVEDDTTRAERRGPEQIEEVRHNTFINTPNQMDIPEEDMNRYQISDYNNMYGFYRRLQSQSPRDFLLSEEAGHYLYGPEWEREINAQLMAILQATFKEQNSILQVLSRIAPFLGFGFFEEYEVPVVPRNEDPDRVYVDE